MIDVDWGDANETILVWTFSNGWSGQDFIDAIDISKRATAKKENRRIIHTLMDIQHTAHLPKDMFSLARQGIREGVNSNYAGLVIIINPSQLWHRLYNMVKPMVPNSLNICFAKDADEAYRLMREADALPTSELWSSPTPPIT